MSRDMKDIAWYFKMTVLIIIMNSDFRFFGLLEIAFTVKYIGRFI